MSILADGPVRFPLFTTDCVNIGFMVESAWGDGDQAEARHQLQHWGPAMQLSI